MTIPTNDDESNLYWMKHEEKNWRITTSHPRSRMGGLSRPRR